MKDFLESKIPLDLLVETMIHQPQKIVDGIFVGDSSSYDMVKDDPNWSSCLAAQTWHRQKLGYTGRGAPKDSPYYLWHEDRHTLRLNLVDADNVKYIDDRVIEKALVWMLGEYGQHRTVGIFCDQGRSRSPTLAIMLLKRLGHFENQTHRAASAMMNDMLEGTYRPNKGMRDYLERWWARERLDEMIEGDA